MIEQNAATIGATLAARYAPYLRAGETMPDFALVYRLGGRLIEDRVTKLVDANLALEQEATDDAEPRARRDASEAALRERVSFVRSQVIGIFGDPGLRAYAFWEPLPTGPEALESYAVSVVKSLGQPKVVPTAVSRSATFSAEAAAQELRPLIDALHVALDHVAKERSELSTAQLAKNDAMRANDTDFIAVNGLTEAGARAAGRHDIADRLQPSRRDPGVLADTDEPAVDPATPGSAAAPGGPTSPPIEPGMPGSSPFRE